jgi:glutathione peroxidase
MKTFKVLLSIFILISIFSINNIKGENKMANFYDFSVISAKGEEIKMADFKGKVVLIVNTATGCGFTPQYAPIEQMYKDYHSKGLEILDIPCNQFGAQAPGTDDEIREFCTIHYNTTFPQMKKSDVNGDNQLPLFKYLKEQQGFKGFGESKMAQFMKQHLSKIDPNYEKNSDIKWNFTKFVVDKNGNVVARFEPTEDMAVVEKCIKELL